MNERPGDGAFFFARPTKAPFGGEVVDLDPDLAPGACVGPWQPLATLVDPSRWQADLSRLKTGSAVASSEFGF